MSDTKSDLVQPLMHVTVDQISNEVVMEDDLEVQD